MLYNEAYKKFFDIKYKKGGWKWRKDISPSDYGSGAGSSLRETEDFREFLKHFIKDNGIKSCLDVGCGDFTYMKEVYKLFERYVGLDVSELVINRNKELYETENHKFILKNIIYEDIDFSGFELVIVKDCLQHLGNEEVSIILNKIDSIPFQVIVNDPLKNKKHDNLKRPQEAIIGSGSGLNPSLEPFNKNYSLDFRLKNNKMVYVRR